MFLQRKTYMGSSVGRFERYPRIPGTHQRGPKPHQGTNSDSSSGICLVGRIRALGRLMVLDADSGHWGKKDCASMPQPSTDKDG